ncbi:LuxR C-terminal-related transcriptional regulator [Streptomyces silvisoli]|uniref:LuxR C-terminal-related transcriptional regulator n=1 Tax=Streptomyces silvisoli TaxID=3034235 RepID=A0ABT5ZWB7_9ACTN|nr:LuxR C-terminal-related transcriptional regulator [Streptomyces silvisoli]MDF3293799.1 LuxR C-terminal-related transcriptional regulator [Streptomyces silvisoli]
MARIRVLVVDDHRIFAESLAAALAAEPDVDVSAAGSAPAAQRCLERAAADGRRYDVLLVDADLGGVGATVGHPAAPPRTPALPPGRPPAPQVPVQRGPEPRDQRPEPPRGTPPTCGDAYDGIALVEKVRAHHPGTRTVVLAGQDDARRAARALQAGACGWVAKDSSLSRLLAVVRGVLRDETHLPPALLTGVLRELTTARRHRTESERLVESLTPREQEVLRCMVAGLGRKAVAERLYLSPHTVRTHMQNVLGKLGVHSTLAAVALARRAGVGPADLAVPAGSGKTA